MSRKAKAMRRIVPVMAVLALAGCGMNGPAHQAPMPDASAVVDLGLMSFSQGTVNVTVGQTVEWRNSSIVTHTVTDDPAKAESVNDSVLPPGAMPFNSGDIPAGGVFAYKFAVPGTYRYFCLHHESEGMVGTVIVAPAS